MKRNGHNNAILFIGGEVEKTPAFAKKTLFVVGFQDTATVEKYANEHKVQHIFLGANHSFDASNYTEYFGKTWNDQITYLLDKGFWVTLDYQAHEHATVLKMLNPGIWQSRIFVPLLSVRIPHVETSSPNLTVKIDDIDFEATNPGVWCMNFHEVTDSNRFTDWIEYGTDVIIKEDHDRKVFHLDIGDKTPAEAEKIIDAVREQMNNTDLGLDPDATSKLKPENEETKVSPIPFSASPADAVEAYTKGTTSDPLSSKASKKVAKK